MREIKFRAKVKNVTGWIYSDGFMKHKDGTVIVIVSKEEEKVITSPIEENTLCEFTGLKDCNGIDIYENDIIVYMHNKMNHFVKYKGNGFVLTDSRDNVFVYNFNPIALEIVGNTIDNPEFK